MKRDEAFARVREVLTGAERAAEGRDETVVIKLRCWDGNTVQVMLYGPSERGAEIVISGSIGFLAIPVGQLEEIRVSESVMGLHLIFDCGSWRYGLKTLKLREADEEAV